ncbi:hypothetical protein ANN_00928 [Periplaneta americana]|uniref:DDE-1 domain-containing protein n=1 Tax=Periplaneta americana TaxID=6978 RepID=A0ABQ8TTY1_PERAM|nr:hypothetical protein ANN_00928 [Periplaneta americana]
MALPFVSLDDLVQMYDDIYTTSTISGEMLEVTDFLDHNLLRVYIRGRPAHGKLHAVPCFFSPMIWNMKRRVGKVASAERGQIVSIVCCLPPTGIYIPPAVIFPRKRLNPELYRDAPEGILHLISDSGFMNTELFVEWLQHFTQFVKPTKRILHHTSYSAPNASHMIQPLDKSFFVPLKSAYSTERDKFMVRNPRRVITHREVASPFCRAYEKVATLEKAKNSFRATGIFPFNPEIFTEDDFLSSAVSSRPEPNQQTEERKPQQKVQLNPDVEESQQVRQDTFQTNFISRPDGKNNLNGQVCSRSSTFSKPPIKKEEDGEEIINNDFISIQEYSGDIREETNRRN